MCTFRSKVKARYAWETTRLAAVFFFISVSLARQPLKESKSVAILRDATRRMYFLQLCPGGWMIRWKRWGWKDVKRRGETERKSVRGKKSGHVGSGYRKSWEVKSREGQWREGKKLVEKGEGVVIKYGKKRQHEDRRGRRRKRRKNHGVAQGGRRLRCRGMGWVSERPRSRPGEFLMARWDRKIRRKKGPPWLRGRAESAIISQKRSRVFGTNCFLARKQCCQISLRA